MLKGFKFSAVEAAIKKPGRLDLALIFSDLPAAAAGLYTTNLVQAAPVKVSKPRTDQGVMQAVVVNSGNANAATGPQGVKDAEETAALVAKELGIRPELVGVCSTGVIGRPMPMDRVRAAAGPLAAGLKAGRADDFAQAIMTTDTFAKKVEKKVQLGDAEATILGLAKGAGMIHPNLATMLVFILTDAQVTAQALKDALTEALPGSFHGLTVDGDTSTNDSVICLANGAAGGEAVHGMWSPAGRAFFAALAEVCQDLALMIVDDAEGATKRVTIHIKGAGMGMEADMAAVSIALSPLCKTAFFGADPNWGRIICAAGYSGARFDPEKIDIFIGDVPVYQSGQGADEDALERAAAVMRQRRFDLTVDLKNGDAERVFVTSDLSYDYVRINAEYTT